MTAKKARRPQAPHQVAPTKDRDKLFCERWLAHFDKNRAYREAGFNTRGLVTNATKKLSRFMEYLRPLQEAKAREVAKVLVMNEEDVLKGMTRKALFDPRDFVERTDKPVLEEIKQGRKKISRVRTWEGKPVYGERMKPFSDLTPEQRLTVEVTGVVGDQVQYRLPTTREQMTAQVNIGRQFGMFLEKLIIERHQSRGATSTLALTNVPTGDLQNLTLQLLPFVGQEFASRLGFTLEDIEDAKKRVVSEVGARS